MMLFSVGLPGRFADWCDATLRGLAERAWGVAVPLRADTTDEIALEVIRNPSVRYVVNSRHPSTRIGAVLSQARAPFVLVLDDPRAAIHYLVTERQTDFVEAVRIVARGCASLVAFAEHSGALVLRAGTDEADPVATALAINRHYGFDIDPRTVSGVEPPAPYDRASSIDWWAGLDERRHEIASGALDGFIAYFGGGELGPLLWLPELFYIFGPLPGMGRAPALRPVDITGRPRCLLNGPHLALPSGTWSATVALELSLEAGDMGYSLEMMSDAVIASARIEPANTPRRELALSFAIDGDCEQPLELRVSNERPAFDGQLAIHHMALASAEPIRAPNPALFDAMLVG
jgi:hypothetical protein